MTKDNTTFEAVSYLNDLVITSDEFMLAYKGIQQCAERSVHIKNLLGVCCYLKVGLEKQHYVKH